MNKKQFIKIFSNPKLRTKLDKIILNAYGLKLKNVSPENISSDIYLKISLCYDNTHLLTIKLLDIKPHFKTNQSIVINIITDYLEQPNPYYNFHYQVYSSKKCLEKKHKNKLELIASLFSCCTKKELKSCLTHLKVFNKREINDMINLVFKK